jgi:hypothetical protein
MRITARALFALEDNRKVDTELSLGDMRSNGQFEVE